MTRESSGQNVGSRFLKRETLHEMSNEKRPWLGCGLKYFLFSPLPGEMIQFDYCFSNGLKPPTSWYFWSYIFFVLPGYMGSLII